MYWDIVKGVAILFVILGHALQYSCKEEAGYINNVFFKFIYGMHMPLFMFMSGYFFYHSTQKHDSIDILQTRTRQCLLPIVTLTVIACLMHKEYAPLHIIGKIVGVSYWFLWALFWLSCIMLVIKKWPLYIHILICFISFAIPTFGISKYIWFMYPFFLAGFWFNKKSNIKSIIDRNIVLFAGIGGILYFGLLFLIKKEVYIYWSTYTVLYGSGFHQVLLNLQRLLTGFSGTLFVLGLIRVTYKHYFRAIQRFLSYLGRNTLQLYVISTFFIFQKIESFFASESINSLTVIIAFVSITIISIAIVSFLKRFSITNFLFFGEKLKTGWS